MQFTKALYEVLGTKGLIVDIRGNVGGDDEQTTDFNGYFIPDKSQPQYYENSAFSNRFLNKTGAPQEL